MTQGLVNYPTMGKDILIFINGNYDCLFGVVDVNEAEKLLMSMS